MKLTRGESMVKVKQDLTGMTFGRLTVLEQADDHIQPNGVHRPRWKCQCGCEEQPIVIVQGSDLKYGHTQSCGCLNREKVKKYNNFKLYLEDEHGLYGIGYCRNTGNKFYFDMADYDLIKEYCWVEYNHKGYHSLQAWDIGGEKRNVIMSHLLGCKFYDHEDRNPLNNRRYNLRPATNSQNTVNRGIFKNNTSGVTGVHWDERTQTWQASLQFNHEPVLSQRYPTKRDAIIARLAAEQQYLGEFSPQKHLFKQYGLL